MNQLISASSLICIIALITSSYAVDTWTDISTTLITKLASQGQTQGTGFLSGCSGAAVNRLTGDVVIKVIGLGLYRSTDKGKSWSSRIDNNTIGGRNETGWGFDVDQDNPVRMAVFSLDGGAGLTSNGTTWKSFTIMGRNWDFGSVDWASADPKIILGYRHEFGAEVDLSTDGGTTWKYCFTGGAGMGIDQPVPFAIGVIDAATIMKCDAGGIFRSSDLGSTWANVSSAAVRTRTLTKFKGTCYLGTATGLVVSKDKGLTWQTQGGSVSINQGPFFGADENTMVVVGTSGIYKTINVGTTWIKISGVAASTGGYSCNPNWFGCYTWDPFNNVLYATSMGNSAKINELGPTSVSNQTPSVAPFHGVSYANSTIRSFVPFNNVEVFSLTGRLIYRQQFEPVYSIYVPQFSDVLQSRLVFRITDMQGVTRQLSR